MFDGWCWRKQQPSQMSSLNKPRPQKSNVCTVMGTIFNELALYSTMYSTVLVLNNFLKYSTRTGITMCDARLEISHTDLSTRRFGPTAMTLSRMCSKCSASATVRTRRKSRESAGDPYKQDARSSSSSSFVRERRLQSRQDARRTSMFG